MQAASVARVWFEAVVEAVARLVAAVWEGVMGKEEEVSGSFGTYSRVHWEELGAAPIDLDEVVHGEQMDGEGSEKVDLHADYSGD